MKKRKIVRDIPIKIAIEEVFRYLGSQKLPNNTYYNLQSLIKEEVEQSYLLLESKGIYSFFDIISLSEEGVIILEQGYQFSINKKIMSFFQNAQYLLLAVATIGPKIEQYTRERFKQNQYLRAMVLDAVGTVAIKTVGQWLNHFIEEQKKLKGFKLSCYFEPGSGDWDIQDQKKIFALLKPEKIGVTLNSSLMMQPAKSLSWIRAMGRNLIHSYRDEFSCQYCLLTNCPFRKRQ